MRSRTLLILLLAVCLIAPVIANPNGPPWENSQGDLTVEGGCTCHGVGGPVNGQPSTEVVVSISGIPRSYDEAQHTTLSSTYNMHLTIMADSCFGVTELGH